MNKGFLVIRRISFGTPNEPEKYGFAEYPMKGFDNEEAAKSMCSTLNDALNTQLQCHIGIPDGQGSASMGPKVVQILAELHMTRLVHYHLAIELHSANIETARAPTIQLVRN